MGGLIYAPECIYQSGYARRAETPKGGKGKFWSLQKKIAGSFFFFSFTCPLLLSMPAELLRQTNFLIH